MGSTRPMNSRLNSSGQLGCSSVLPSASPTNHQRAPVGNVRAVATSSVMGQQTRMSVMSSGLSLSVDRHIHTTIRTHTTSSSGTNTNSNIVRAGVQVLDGYDAVHKNSGSVKQCSTGAYVGEDSTVEAVISPFHFNTIMREKRGMRNRRQHGRLGMLPQSKLGLGSHNTLLRVPSQASGRGRLRAGGSALHQSRSNLSAAHSSAHRSPVFRVHSSRAEQEEVGSPAVVDLPDVVDLPGTPSHVPINTAQVGGSASSTSPGPRGNGDDSVNQPTTTTKKVLRTMW